MQASVQLEIGREERLETQCRRLSHSAIVSPSLLLLQIPLNPSKPSSATPEACEVIATNGPGSSGMLLRYRQERRVDLEYSRAQARTS
eukprot:21093-Heterococcus_DN1.PRE.2